ncbi:MAG: hypothetical protein ACTSWW_06440 [Promethearchaeota archaeon]
MTESAENQIKQIHHDTIGLLVQIKDLAVSEIRHVTKLSNFNPILTLEKIVTRSERFRDILNNSNPISILYRKTGIESFDPNIYYGKIVTLLTSLHMQIGDVATLFNEIIKKGKDISYKSTDDYNNLISKFFDEFIGFSANFTQYEKVVAETVLLKEPKIFLAEDQVPTFDQKDALNESIQHLSKTSGIGLPEYSNGIIEWLVHEVKHRILDIQGGTILFSDLYEIAANEKPGWPISPKKFLKLLRKMHQLGLITDIQPISSNSKRIIFAPVGLSGDPSILLSLSNNYDYLTQKKILVELKWDLLRLEEVISYLKQTGTIREENTYLGGKKYYFLP